MSKQWHIYKHVHSYVHLYFLQTVVVRMRESYKSHLKGDIGIVDAVREEWDPPIQVNFTYRVDPPDRNDSARVDYHNIEIESMTPLPPKTNVPGNFTRMPNKYCTNSRDRYHPSTNVTTAEACSLACRQDPQCVSAEFYSSDPKECSMSRLCSLEDVQAATEDSYVTLFLKNKLKRVDRRRKIKE